MSYPQLSQLGKHLRGNKKKSDEFLKRKTLDPKRKEDPLPVHAIREPNLADKSFVLPKIPKKPENPPVQLSMAEIADENSKIELDIPVIADEIQEVVTTVIVGPPLNEENLLISITRFAETQKVSLISLLKLLIPKIDGHKVIVTMTKQQEELIGDIKIEWQAFLKNYFKNPQLNLHFQIEEMADTKRHAYTPAEQFEEMLEENEMFRKMVNQFKLKLKT